MYYMHFFLLSIKSYRILKCALEQEAEMQQGASQGPAVPLKIHLNLAEI